MFLYAWCDHPVPIFLLEANKLQRMENWGHFFLTWFVTPSLQIHWTWKRACADSQLITAFPPSQLWWSTSVTVWCGRDAGASTTVSTTHACTDADFYSMQNCKACPLFLIPVSISEGKKQCLVLSAPLGIKQEYNYFCVSFVQRYSRKSSSIYENKSETSNVEASNNKNRNSSPSARQKRGRRSETELFASKG